MTAAAISAAMAEMGRAAKEAARTLALAPGAQRDAALQAMAKAVVSNVDTILEANAHDLRALAPDANTPAFRDRLALSRDAIAAIARGIEAVAAQPDPLGQILAKWTQPNGLKIARVAVPLGVIGVIFESRPNVAADAGALAIKSGNAVILRAGSEALRSCLALHRCLVRGLQEAGLPAAALQIVPHADREAVGAMLQGLNGTLDLIVPRGGKGLTARVQAEARVPVLAHLDGINHVYVHRDAVVPMAVDVVRNAKLRRVSVCGAAEALLLDQGLAADAQRAIVGALLDGGCEVRGDAAVQALDARVRPAEASDWGQEFLAPIMAARVVAGLDQALAHIAQYGSQHTDAIITEDAEVAQHFLARCDSAIVLWNASTQFADGGEFG
ncbi:MAG TPA: glutamate-5-semialdehyde dehydrogenase, partial [Alphaproteobacteria bacterium]|nr:glutamate-5-semialdehyde dehydrogenase [Alphaproteobacteria bacterium]